MNFNLTKPCANCPFRTDVHFHFSKGRARDIAEGIVDEQQTFSCHKTVDYSSDDGGADTDKTEHCAGAMIMLEHMDRPNQMMRIAERFGIYDRTKLKMDSPVFTDANEFIEVTES